jgi:hypothetical protein
VSSLASSPARLPTSARGRSTREVLGLLKLAFVWVEKEESDREGEGEKEKIKYNNTYNKQTYNCYSKLSYLKELLEIFLGQE